MLGIRRHARTHTHAPTVLTVSLITNRGLCNPWAKTTKQYYGETENTYTDIQSTHKCVNTCISIL